MCVAESIGGLDGKSFIEYLDIIMKSCDLSVLWGRVVE